MLIAIIIIILLYVSLKEPTWQEECHKRRGGGKCGGVYGGDNTTNYLSNMCIDCPYLEV